MYSSYNREDVNIYISGFCVFLQSTAAALGTFLGSFAVDLIGYNWAFISASLAMVAFTISYAVFVGPGDHIDENEDVIVKKEPPKPENEDVELSK